MRIKGITLYMTAVLLLTGLPMAYGSPGPPAFNDIKGSYAEESINRLAEQGIISGAGGEFRPGDNVTRLEFAVLLAKILGIQAIYPPVPAFPDISPGTPEAGCVESLAKLGIIKGAGEGFNPGGPVLRQDAAVLVHRALGHGFDEPVFNGKYNDSGLISSYAVRSVAYVSGKGLMSGSDNNFYPLREMTRAEASVLLGKLLEERKWQAMAAFKAVSAQKISMRTGEDRQIKLPPARKYPPFTPVYGTENPAVGAVSPEGVISGKQQGQGVITVNEGYNYYLINTKVASKAVDNAPGSVTGEVYAGNTAETDLEISYSVAQQSPDTAFQNTEHQTHPGPAEGLASKSDTWTGFLRQQGRDITVDLKTARAVTEISMEFMQDSASGIYLPGYMKCEASYDGSTWYHLGYVYHQYSPSETGEKGVNLTISFPPVKARYVRVSFPVDIWVFARHLSVKGGSVGQYPVILAPAGQKADYNWNYLQVPGINDILLLYTGNNSEHQNLTPPDFLPLVGYRDGKGEIKGRMFDTMLFLPYYGIPGTRDSWAAYIEDLFAPGKQLAALEEAVAKMNRLSGMQVREKVILSIPYPGVKPEGFAAAEGGERWAAVQWYYGEIMGRWKGAGFKNLDLAGIYWYGESIENNYADEKELVRNTSRLVKGDGHKFFWIPYFGTKGYENWISYGFSHVFLQPNYFAQDSPPEDRMEGAAELARQYCLGIEIELEENVLYNQDYYNLFYNQLKKGHQLGFDGPMTNAYYAGHIKKTLVKAAGSDVPEIRAIYDDLYRWISGTYQ